MQAGPGPAPEVNGKSPAAIIAAECGPLTFSEVHHVCTSMQSLPNVGS